MTRRDAPMPTFQSYTEPSVKLREHSQTLPTQTQLRNKVNQQRHSLSCGEGGGGGGVGVVATGPPEVLLRGGVGNSSGGDDHVILRDSAQRCHSLK